MKPFVFELYTEEIPAKYQASAAAQWQEKITPLLKEFHLEFEAIQIGATSKRLCLIIEKLAEEQTSSTEIVKGPPQKICFDSQNKPTTALLGFAQKVNLDWSQIEFKELQGQNYAFAQMKLGGKKTTEVLATLLKNLILSTRFPKVMRWGNLSLEYPRPIIGYNCLLGSVQVSLSDTDFFCHLTHLKKFRFGFFPDNALALTDAGDYVKSAASAGIILDSDRRRSFILTLLEKSAADLNLQFIKNEQLLNEVNFLVEHPQIISGEFDQEFLRLPDILILSEMADHQRYFGLRKSDGSLSNTFLIVSNKKDLSSSAIAHIKTGNQRVLRARLSDGSFFFDEDMATKLIDKCEKLKSVVYQEGMGTIFDKKNRLAQIAAKLNKQIFANRLDPQKISRIADLCKADLTTKLVYEFDHLQGQIGAVYARKNGEPPEICEAIYQHYLPKSMELDDFPQGDYSVCFSLADKLDNILAGFLLEKQPSSSQDPLALRRQALAIIEIIIRHRFSFDFPEFITTILSLYPDLSSKTDLSKKVWDFIQGRLETILIKRDFPKVFVRAILQISNQNIYDLYCRVENLLQLRQDSRFEVLMSGFTRMANIVGDSELKTSTLGESEINPKLFEKSCEAELFDFAKNLAAKQKTIQDNNYAPVYQLMISAKNQIDAFFNDVMVNHENKEIRTNRLKLLRYIVQQSETLIDLKQLK